MTITDGISEKEFYEIIKVQAEEVINMGLFLGIYGFNQIPGAKFPSSSASGHYPSAALTWYHESLSYFSDPKEAAEQDSARFIFGMMGGKVILPPFADDSSSDFSDTMRRYASKTQTASLVAFLNNTMLHYYHEHPYWFSGSDPFSYIPSYISDGLLNDNAIDITVVLPSVIEDQHRPDIRVNGLIYKGAFGFPLFADRVRLEYTYDSKEFYGETKKVPVGLMPAFVIMDAVSVLSSVVTTGYFSEDLFRWNAVSQPYKHSGIFADRIDRNPECVQEFYRSSYVEMAGLHSYTQNRSKNLASTMQSIEDERDPKGEDNLYRKLIPLEFRNTPFDPYKTSSKEEEIDPKSIVIKRNPEERKNSVYVAPEGHDEIAEKVLEAEKSQESANIEPIEIVGTPLQSGTNEEAVEIKEEQVEPAQEKASSSSIFSEISKYIRDKEPAHLSDEAREYLNALVKTQKEIHESFVRPFMNRKSVEVASQPSPVGGFLGILDTADLKIMGDMGHNNPKPLKIFARRHDILNDSNIVDKNREIAKISSMSAAWTKQREREEIFMQITGLDSATVTYALHYIGNSTYEEDLLAAAFIIDTYFAVMELNGLFYVFHRAAISLPQVGVVFNKIVEDHKYCRVADYEDHIGDENGVGFNYDAVKLYTLSQEIYREARMKGIVGIVNYAPHAHVKKTLIEELNEKLRIECRNQLTETAKAIEERQKREEDARKEEEQRLEEERRQREEKLAAEENNMTKIANENISGLTNYPYDNDFAQLLSNITLPAQVVYGIARIAYEQNRVFSYGIGEHVVHNEEISPAWETLNGNVQLAIAKRVCEIILYGESNPVKNHAKWMESKQNDGWVYGEVKDNEAKTHPALRPYNELPARTKVKDDLFLATVKNLAIHISTYHEEASQ